MATYLSLNPSDTSSNITLSAGNSVMTAATGGTGFSRGVPPLPLSQFMYYEVVLSPSAANNTAVVGIADRSASLSGLLTTDAGFLNVSDTIPPPALDIVTNGTDLANFYTLACGTDTNSTAGGRFGVLLDTTNKKMYVKFFVASPTSVQSYLDPTYGWNANPGWNGFSGGNPVTPGSGYNNSFPTVSSFTFCKAGVPHATFYVNFGADPFFGVVPTGYTPTGAASIHRSYTNPGSNQLVFDQNFAGLNTYFEYQITVSSGHEADVIVGVSSLTQSNFNYLTAGGIPWNQFGVMHAGLPITASTTGGNTFACCFATPSAFNGTTWFRNLGANPAINAGGVDLSSVYPSGNPIPFGAVSAFTEQLTFIFNPTFWQGLGLPAGTQAWQQSLSNIVQSNIQVLRA